MRLGRLDRSQPGYRFATTGDHDLLSGRDAVQQLTDMFPSLLYADSFHEGSLDLNVQFVTYIFVPRLAIRHLSADFPRRLGGRVKACNNWYPICTFGVARLGSESVWQPLCVSNALACRPTPTPNAHCLGALRVLARVKILKGVEKKAGLGPAFFDRSRGCNQPRPLKIWSRISSTLPMPLILTYLQSPASASLE